ncbi:uncharacterized protein LOC105693355 isoform X3 [Athalia rosae]|uniref:uncharacterized protein LOC105693355 isoform X3 n=1 Tax=Athalia rosae TaxID=37344 RepID=UPI0020343877|nr:uncharacterized protein LOC105693355 isoform X3 [Athalia rosae]
MYPAVDTHSPCTFRLLIITVFTVLTARSAAAMPSRDARSVASSLESSIAKEVPPIVTSVKANGRTKRHESARNDRRNLTTEKTSSDVDAIKFPDESHGIQSRNFVPVLDPSCDGRTFCEEISAYPQEYVSNVISRSGNIQGFSGVDKTKVVFPKTARNEDMEWLFIVQDEKKGYKQGVKVENCDEGTIEGACKIIEGSIFGYKTSCKQKFVSRVLAAVGKNGTAITEKFSMPSSCCCQIKLVGADAIGSRLSGNAGKNHSPAGPVKRGRRY